MAAKELYTTVGHVGQRTRKIRTLGKGPPSCIGFRVPNTHCDSLSPGMVSQIQNTYLLCGIDTPIVPDVHFPLVESSNREWSISLRLRHTSVLEIRNSTSCNLKQPGCE